MDEETPVPFKNYFPNLSMSSYFWVVILIALIVFGMLGFFVGVRVNELPFSSTQSNGAASQYQPLISLTPIPGDDNDMDYSSIGGSFVTNTNQYDQFVIYINGVSSGASTIIDSDNRSFVKPVAGVQYPYMFSRLNPSSSYTVSASFCRVNTKTYALVCANNIKMTKCTGTIQGKTCVIKGNGNEFKSSGEVDFSVPSGNGVTPMITPVP